MPSSIVSLEPLSSPSPSPPPPEEPNTTSSTHSGAAGLDSGSELSELTEDEQEDNKENGAKDSDSRTSTRESKRKRGGLIPGPMWQWAYKPSKKGEWRSRPVLEEEEEEPTGPARAMEEEEDEDQDDWTYGQRPERRPPGDSEGKLGREENHADTRVLITPIQVSPERLFNGTGDGCESGEEEDEDDEEPEAAVSIAPSQAQSQKGGTSPDLSDDEGVEDEEMEEDVPEDDAAAVVSDIDEMVAEPVTADPATPIDGALPILEDAAVEGDLDDPTLPLPFVATNVPNAAGSSIMAGSTVVDPPSPSPSSSPSASGSPASSRSASPEPDVDAQSDREEPEPTSIKPSSSRPSGRNRKGRARDRSRKLKIEAGPAQEAQMDVDADQTIIQDADEVDAADGEDVEPDSPEMELESDLQPAHRAEALDVLATIELKFALLRERLYVEKMENLAWEEALVVDGAHPELLHLHTELSKRRDKRLQLAARRRDYEVANVTKRRKLDEDGVWSWWKFERDELQTDMISETNRKRRKLERERRALDRPQPERRIPSAPQVVEPPPTLRDIVKTYPFGISSSYSQPSKQRGRTSPNALAYPQLSTLAPAEIAHDLDFLYQHRRMAPNFDHRSAMLTSALGGPPPPHIYDYPVNMPMVDGPGAGNRFGPPLPSALQHQHLHGYPQVSSNSLVQGFPGQPPRLPHHHSAPAGGLPSLHPSQIVMDQDMVPVHRPDSRSALVGVHVQSQFASMGSMSAHGNLMRRSISPVQVQVLHHGSGHNMPMGAGQATMLSSGLKPNGWVGVGPPGPNSLPGGAKEPRKPSSVADAGRERGKERERYPGEMEADRAEREREADREQEKMHQIQLMQQRQSGHQHPHPPIHSAQVQAPHRHLGPHHHHHHHHHIHHHHHANGASNNGQGPSVSTLPPGRTSGPGAHSHQHDPRYSESHSGTPGEAVEMSASSSRQSGHRSPRMSTLWKTNDEPPPLPPSGEMSQRERQALELLPLGPDEGSMTPIGTMPTQVMQSKFPGSPRSGFVPPTVLGHWSGRGNAVEDMGDPVWRDRSINQAWPNGRRGREILNLPSLPPPPPLTSAHSPPARAPSPLKGSSPSLKTLGRPPSSPNSRQPSSRLASMSSAEQQAAGGAHAANHLRTTPPLPLLTSPSHKFHKSIISEPLLGTSAVAPKVVPVDGTS